jgi:two-component system OmpR family response regulator
MFPTPVRILIIEDDRTTGRSLERGLNESGYECVWVRDGRRGLDEALTGQFDAVVLDLLLPEQPGLDVLRELRAAGLRTPVILLTALGSIEERVAGLNAGADDYLVKPFALAELVARLQAVARRSAVAPPAALAAAGLKLDLTTRKVEFDGVAVELTPTEFSLLELLMRHAGQVVTRRMVCEHIWQSDWEGVTNVIEVHVRRLRGKLDQAGARDVVRTVRGRGYAIRAT